MWIVACLVGVTVFVGFACAVTYESVQYQQRRGRWSDLTLAQELLEVVNHFNYAMYQCGLWSARLLNPLWYATHFAMLQSVSYALQRLSFFMQPCHFPLFHLLRGFFAENYGYYCYLYVVWLYGVAYLEWSFGATFLLGLAGYTVILTVLSTVTPTTPMVPATQPSHSW